MHNTKYMNTYHHAKQHILYIQFPPQKQEEKKRKETINHFNRYIYG